VLAVVRTMRSGLHGAGGNGGYGGSLGTRVPGNSDWERNNNSANWDCLDSLLALTTSINSSRTLFPRINGIRAQCMHLYCT